MASTTQQQQQPQEDPFDFDSLLNLEEDFYQQGYVQGVSDGVKAGRTEGRQLGLEKGFQKFVQSGRLHGRAIVWANRLPCKQPTRHSYLLQSQQAQQPQSSSSKSVEQSHQKLEDSDSLEKKLSLSLSLSNNKAESSKETELPLLPSNNARLEKHITTLFALVETETLAKENTDEAVNDFDDRLKRAQGKAKIIERMVGEVSERKKASATATAGSVVTSPGEGGTSGSGTGTPIAGVDLGRIGNEV
ncbi:hypothetical protein N0V85_004793 [Neurospora sp. IMI 360204]|nr:hypothetical protein N0V85_004793 [Neurospora sp. IMI 360204]